jgi:hypothetical protein
MGQIDQIVIWDLDGPICLITSVISETLFVASVSHDLHFKLCFM